MAHIRNVQATNMLFSSWALVFLVTGIILEQWVELKLGPEKPSLPHSPWICCTTDWPEGGLKVVRDMMLLVFSLSLLHNLLLGLEFTYMIPQTKHILFMTASLSFFTGALLLSALVLYQHHLRQAESVYHYSYRVTWNFFIAYSTIFFFIASGFLSFLQHKQSMNSSASLTIIPESAQEDQVMEQSGASVKDLVLPADAAVPRSIVHVHATQAKDSPSRTQVQGRRVTWAL
ncbi:transmembrane protein 225-like [Camelus dromedarius]|uniref:Transmembrane protein 225 n=2 Tax=Camelus TaxID=9836 RepID=A0A8B6YFE9_CAMFR|nr:transmembrane protein 225 [Camelus ferus]